MLTLHAYQRRAANILHDVPKSILALDLGLGKTATTLTAISELIMLGDLAPPVLVVAPQRVAKHVWPTEVEKWAPHLSVVSLDGTPKEREAKLAAGADIFTVGKELLPWVAERLAPEMLVFDDCPPRRGTERFKLARKLGKTAKRLVLLTATPAPNGVEQLFPMVGLCDGGARLGKTYTAFQSRFMEPDKRSRDRIFTWKPRAGAFEEIMGLVKDVMVSMSSEDYLQLPERIDNTISVSVPLEPYRRFERDLFMRLDGDAVTAANAAVLCGKLQQFANGCVYDETRGAHEVHDAKLDALAEIEGDVLVFYGFQHDRDRIMARFPYAEALDVEKWNDGKQRMALAHPASAGHGLNLQAHGDGVVWFGPTYSLEQYQQANARLHRQGRKKPVVIHHLIAAGTLDELVMEVLAGKKNLQDVILERTKA